MPEFSIELYEKIVVLPNKMYDETYLADERFTGFTFLYACDGASKIQGRRFKEIWIHWYCCDEGDNFIEMVGAISNILSFSPPDYPIPQQLFF
jgi:hypothetical protein